MPDDRPPIPDGYEYAEPTGTQIRLIDPVWCPAGHPAVLTQRSHINCQEHGELHHYWTCACGQVIWRYRGTFVDELPCR